MKKVFLGLPTYGGSLKAHFVDSVFQLLLDNPIPDVQWSRAFISGDGVARARNNLAQMFLLNSDCEYLFFVDVDIVANREHYERILSHVSPTRPIVGGLYAAKQVNHRWIKTDLQDEHADHLTGLKKVQECGTGFKCYHRSYFEQVMAAFPEIQYFCDASPERPVKWDFFSMGVVNGRYLSEDYYADYRARVIGMDIFVDTKCEVQHEGYIRYPLNANWECFDGISVQKLWEMGHVKGGQPMDFEKVFVSPKRESAPILPLQLQPAV